MNEALGQILFDFNVFSGKNLKIKTKEGALAPFFMNRAQSYLHERLEEQLKKQGYVRAVVIKGRQQGISTYIGARFYWKTTTAMQKSTFIFAHDASGTESLFKMVRRFYDNCEPALQPHLGACNRNELSFDRLGSGYRVGTAGSGGLGRSQTNQYLHWSEVDYSPTPEEHAQGIMQTVPSLPGTEIILESTAKTAGAYFHRMVLQGLDDKSEWMTVFIPWYFQNEYQKPVSADFSLTPEEQKLLDLYASNGLTAAHLNWRRTKLADFLGDLERFKREYPFSIEEAFEISDENALISSDLVTKAIQTVPVTGGAMIMGIDPARLGGDEFRITVRQGRSVLACYQLPQCDTQRAADLLAIEFKKWSVQYVNIDVGGLGVGVYDALVARGFGSLMMAVNFGAAADETSKYVNKRNEMYARALAWFQDEPVSLSLLDNRTAEALRIELCTPQKGWDNNQRLKIESKEDIKKRLGCSPDKADSFVLTFARQVADPAVLARLPGVFETDTNWSVF